MLIWSVAKTKRFFDGRRRRRVISHYRLSVFWWESEHLHFRLLISGFGVFGGESEWSFFELLGFVLKLVEQFNLTVPDAQESLPNGL